jgi:hypothetical protein
LSVGDSGGAVFIKEGTTWKLAGINLSVDGPYNTSATGAGFQASIFDEGALYKGGEGKWQFKADSSADIPGAFYAIRISSRAAWIQSVVAANSGACAPGADDFNFDERADLLFQDDQGFVAAWFMERSIKKSGSFLNPEYVGPEWRISATGDFNKNGHSDIAFQQSDGTIGIWFMSGTTRESAGLTIPANPGDRLWRVAAAGDLNGDGRADLIFQHSDGTLAVWHMDGLQRTTAALLNPPHSGDSNWRVVGSGDWNRDGKTDLCFQHTAGTLGVWFMDGASRIDARLVTPQDSGDSLWRVAGTADLNQDGHTDLLWQHNSSGQIGIWFMNGTSRSESQLFTPSTPGGTWKIVGPK